MKKTLLVLAIGSSLLSGCATYLPMGNYYVGVKKGEVANNSVAATKSGKACSHSYLSLIATGDSSVDAAKKAGDIKNVATMDYSVENILGLYGTYCTEISGN